MKFLEQADYNGQVNRKTIKICQNQHADLDSFILAEDSLETKRDLELVSRHHFL